MDVWKAKENNVGDDGDKGANLCKFMFKKAEKFKTHWNEKG